MDIHQLPLNTLPPGFRNWLKFYDRLPAELRDEPVIKGEHTADGKRIEWQVQRDYYLARVAEELLPSRYSYEELRVLETVLYNNTKTANSPAPDPSSFVSRLYKVVLPR
jgi:hypothetical protein